MCTQFPIDTNQKHTLLESSMNNQFLQDILRSVEVMFDPTQSANEKAVASTLLSQLTESPNYANIAMEILNSRDLCILFFDMLRISDFI